MAYEQWFAYPSYRPNQKVMLDAVERCVGEGEHAVLMVDAPTGSGKTSAISAVLAAKGTRRVVIALRTTSQVEGYLSEIRRIREHTKKRPEIAYLVGKPKMCPIAGEFENPYAGCELLKILTKNAIEARMRTLGRERYTVDDDAVLTALLEEGRGTQRRACPYYARSKCALLRDGKVVVQPSERAMRDAARVVHSVLSPSELKKTCEHTCPYEVMAVAARFSDIVVLNYHHVLDERMRDVMFRWLNLEPENTVLVLDEAHNVGDAVRSINTARVGLRAVGRALSELDALSRGELDAAIMDDVLMTRGVLKRLTEYVEHMRERKPDDVLDPHALCDFLFAEVLERDDEHMVVRMLDLVEVIRQHKKSMMEFPEVHLARIAEFLRLCVRAKGDETCLVAKGEGDELWAGVIDPSPHLRRLVDSVSCTIMLSGTLSPIDAYELYFFGESGRAQKLVLPNSFPASNRLVLASKSATTLSSMRNDPHNIAEIEGHIRGLIEGVDGNVALYFTSYGMLEQYRRFCEQCASKSHKRVFIEPKETKAIPRLLSEFFDCASGRGGVLLAVCGGKLSEGVDYAGRSLEGAAVIGLPLSAYTEVQRRINRYYVRRHGRQRGMLLAYTLPALNRAMQALGRVIRSENDIGVLMLCDIRFAKNGVVEYMPSWIRDEMRLVDGDECSMIAGWIGEVRA